MDSTRHTRSVASSRRGSRPPCARRTEPMSRCSPRDHRPHRRARRVRLRHRRAAAAAAADHHRHDGIPRSQEQFVFDMTNRLLGRHTDRSTCPTQSREGLRANFEEAGHSSTRRLRRVGRGPRQESAERSHHPLVMPNEDGEMLTHAELASSLSTCSSVPGNETTRQRNQPRHAALSQTPDHGPSGRATTSATRADRRGGDRPLRLHPCCTCAAP